MGVNELKGNVTLRILNAQRCKKHHVAKNEKRLLNKSELQRKPLRGTVGSP